MQSCKRFSDYHIEDVTVSKEYALNRFTILEIYRDSNCFIDNETNRVRILKLVAYFSNHDLDEIKIGC